MTTTTTNRASDKQIAFATRILTEVLGDGALAAEALNNAMEQGQFKTTKTASAFIDSALAAKRAIDKATPTTREFVTAGFFEMDGRIYKVVPSRSTGRNYAMSLAAPGVRKGTWNYEKGAMYALTESMRLSLEQAKAYGSSHGFCICCGALLTDPKSVEAGIGPVCAKRF